MSIKNGRLWSRTNAKYDGLYVCLLPCELWLKIKENNRDSLDVRTEIPLRDDEEKLLGETDKAALRIARQRGTDRQKALRVMAETDAVITEEGRAKIKGFEADVQYCLDVIQTIRDFMYQEA
jgi:hypothetical protein